MTDKKIFVGQYKKDKKTSNGIFIWPNDKKYKDSWLKGKYNGHGILIANCEKILCKWKNGQKLKWIEDTKENCTNST